MREIYQLALAGSAGGLGHRRHDRPGWTELARMPSRAYWIAVAFVKSRTALRGLVLRAAVVRPHQAELRRDVHDRSAAGPAHGGDDGLGPRKTPLALMSIIRFQSSNRGVPIRSLADARVFTRTLSLPKRLWARPTAFCQVGLARDVEPNEDGLATLRLDVGFGRPALGLEDVADDHLSAFPREKRASPRPSHGPRR